MQKVWIHDVTPRDGMQSAGLCMPIDKKIKYIKKAIEFGMDGVEIGYIERPADFEFCQKAKNFPWYKEKCWGFGSTCRPTNEANEDHQLQMVLDSELKNITIFGKACLDQVQRALLTDPENNLRMICDSVRFLTERGRVVEFDAEHGTDGYFFDKDYFIKCLNAVKEGGGKIITLCDTKGSMNPEKVAQMCHDISNTFPELELGFHAHNDRGLSIANTLAAVKNGATRVHIVTNGYGERTGNANLAEVLLNLHFDGFEIDQKMIENMFDFSEFTARLVGREVPFQSPFIGRDAFTHKAGMHVNAIRKAPELYEFCNPESLNRKRKITVSEQSGKANLLCFSEERGIKISDEKISETILEIGKSAEAGMQYELGDASLEIYLNEKAGYDRRLKLEHKILIDETGKQANANVYLVIDGIAKHGTADGHGPVDAIKNALMDGIEKISKAEGVSQKTKEDLEELKKIHLLKYLAPSVDTGKGSAAVVQTLVTFTDGVDKWEVIASDYDILTASTNAFIDGFEYKLMKLKKNN